MNRKPSSQTRPVTGTQPAPRLPHEHDESSDSQASAPRRVIRQAHDDVVSGQVDTDRGVPMNDAYQRQKNAPAKPPRKPGGGT